MTTLQKVIKYLAIAFGTLVADAPVHALVFVPAAAAPDAARKIPMSGLL